jgi:hypothetical protein
MAGAKPTTEIHRLTRLYERMVQLSNQDRSQDVDNLVRWKLRHTRARDEQKQSCSAGARPRTQLGENARAYNWLSSSLSSRFRRALANPSI